VLTLAEIEDAGTGQFGPSILWKWKMSTPTTPEEFRVDGNSGDPYLFYAYSSTKMSPKADARHWAEALLGREIEDGEKLEPNSLLGKRMQAMIVHEPSPKDGTVRAKISREMPPRAFGTAQPSTPTATKSATPSKSAAAAVDLSGAALRAEIKRTLRKAVLLDVPSLEAFDIDTDDFDDMTLQLMLRQMQDEIAEAAAAAA